MRAEPSYGCVQTLWYALVLVVFAVSPAGEGHTQPPGSLAPSTLVLRSFCKPTFTVDGVKRSSGTGFLLETLEGRRRTYLFTAQHLFSVVPAEMGEHVTHAECKTPTGSRVFTTGAAIPIAGAHPVGPPSELKDVAVFRVIGHSPGLPLATRDVAPGDTVWLLAKPASGRELGTLLHRALVLRTEGFLAYRFDDQSLGPDQTSGAAVINVQGEVVGLNVGYTRSKGELIGVGDRLSTLAAAVKALPQDGSGPSALD